MTSPDHWTTTSGAARDVLGPPEPALPGRWQNALVAGIGLAAVGIATTGTAVAVAFAGGGDQPEEVLPSDVVAFVKVDLDPAAGQKAAAIELAERFPDLGVDGDGDLRDDLLRELLKDEDIDYDTELRPWIGDRLAVAALPGGAEVEPVLVVQHDDRAEAERLLPGLIADAGEPAAFAFSERASYVVVASTQEIADRVASADDVLADDEQYAADLDALDGDQVALAWGDVGGFWDGVPAQERELVAASFPAGFAPSGRAIMGLRLQDDAVELVGRYRGLDLGDEALTTYAFGTGTGEGLLTELPAGAVAAMSLAGLGDQVQALMDLMLGGFGATGDVPPVTEADLAAVEAELGIALPEDLQALLGDEAAAGVYDEQGQMQVAARSRGGDPARGLVVAQQLLDLAAVADEGRLEHCFAYYDEAVAEGSLYATDISPEDFCAGTSASPGPVSTGAVAGLEDGVAFGSTGELLGRVEGGGLGDDELFRRALPDVDGASGVFFVDVQRALVLFGEPDDDLAALEALGITSTGGSDGGFTVRLTVR